MTNAWTGLELFANGSDDSRMHGLEAQDDDGEQPVPMQSTSSMGGAIAVEKKELVIFDSQDPCGELPATYELFLQIGGQWTGVGVEDVSVVVERFERRLVRWWKQEQLVEETTRPE